MWRVLSNWWLAVGPKCLRPSLGVAFLIQSCCVGCVRIHDSKRVNYVKYGKYMLQNIKNSCSIQHNNLEYGFCSYIFTIVILLLSVTMINTNVGNVECQRGALPRYTVKVLNVQIELIIACYSCIIKGRNLCRLLFSYCHTL